MSTSIQTTCPYCGVGCGVLVTPLEDGRYEVKGDPDHPANLGRLCSKGAALGETLGLEGRLLTPEIDGNPVSWGAALDEVAGRFRAIIEEHGPDAVAFYVSGQLLTEDYYVANKLMKGFIGSANIDTNSRLCMSSSVAGHKRAFGSDTVPCSYEDLEIADLVVLVGSNTAWCHPVLFQRLRAAKQARPDLKVVVVDPRRTPTCDIADLHLSIKPGADVALFNGALLYCVAMGMVDTAFVIEHTEGWGDAVAAARNSLGLALETADANLVADAVAAACDLPVGRIRQFFTLFASTAKSITVYSQGVNQWSCGTDKVNAIINCHLATGRIGRPGMGPFSFTGQPNAMGGREVGGLANQLAAHMDFDADALERVRRFWRAPGLATQPGLKAVELFRAVDEGKVKAVWIMATNPAVSLPDADRVRDALRKCDFVVVSDCERHTDTTACAHVLLPALGWGEKEGTVTNSERCISRQRAFLDAPGEAKPDWWIVSQVAARLGFDGAFDYRGAGDIFREHAALSAFENGGSRDFDLGGLVDADYDGLAPTVWPVRSLGGGTPNPARLFADGRFFTPSGRARFIPVEQCAPANSVDGEWPLALNTGRIRDQWHTMTRTARAPRLNAHRPEPFVDIHPADAARHGLEEAGLARIESRWGTMLARVNTTEDQRPGELFVPFHWSDTFARQARTDALVNPVTDPWSGQPESKHTPARIRPAQMAWSGFLLSRRPLSFSADLDYCVQSPGDGALRYEIAGAATPKDWDRWARELMAADGACDWLEFRDPAQGRFRAACVRQGRLESCLFIAPVRSGAGPLPGRDWLATLFSDALPQEARAAILSGRPPKNAEDAGRIVCACFKVGLKTIEKAIRSQKLTSVEEIGKALSAGTGCGSCVAELRDILKAEGAENSP